MPNKSKDIATKTEDDQTNSTDSTGPFYMIVRDLGHLEGRVEALEKTMTKIETALNGITTRIEQIFGIISTNSGKDEGRSSAISTIGMVFGWFVSAAISTATVWVMLKFHS